MVETRILVRRLLQSSRKKKKKKTMLAWTREVAMKVARSDIILHKF